MQSYTSGWSCCSSEVTVIRWHLSILLGVGRRGVSWEAPPALKPASVSLLRQPASLNLTFGMCTVEVVTLPRRRNCGVDSRQVRPRGLAVRMRRLLLSACRALYAVCENVFREVCFSLLPCLANPYVLTCQMLDFVKLTQHRFSYHPGSAPSW